MSESINGTASKFIEQESTATQEFVRTRRLSRLDFRSMAETLTQPYTLQSTHSVTLIDGSGTIQAISPALSTFAGLSFATDLLPA